VQCSALNALRALLRSKMQAPCKPKRPSGRYESQSLSVTAKLRRMRAEALSLDDWSAKNAAPLVEDDKWHVAFAPGEVKVVSLEQLDDLFRLSIVDAETKVWQNGMAEWQPLRVIADLDDQPAPEPKRAYPKPPSPRSAPPPPQRSAPPPPRLQSVAASSSVRPATPPPRPQSVAPAPRSVAPAPRYAEPIALASTQPAFSPPFAVQPIASVRPLIVSTRPSVVQRGGGFGRVLIGLSLLASIAVSLYRNGVLHDAAQSLHQEALFGRLEGALGGPSFGTLAAVEQGSATRLGSSLLSNSIAGLPADAPVAKQASPVEPEAAHASFLQPVHASAQAPVVSLESLKTEQPSVVRPKAEAPAAAAASPSPTPSPKLAGQPSLRATQRVNTASAKPVAVEKRTPAGKPASEMTERQRLNAAIGQSMLAPPPKSKSKASEYDPLNPKL
jgi:GYF domain 2